MVSESPKKTLLLTSLKAVPLLQLFKLLEHLPSKIWVLWYRKSPILGAVSFSWCSISKSYSISWFHISMRSSTWSSDQRFLHQDVWRPCKLFPSVGTFVCGLTFCSRVACAYASSCKLSLLPLTRNSYINMPVVLSARHEIIHSDEDTDHFGARSSDLSTFPPLFLSWCLFFDKPCLRRLFAGVRFSWRGLCDTCMCLYTSWL